MKIQYCLITLCGILYWSLWNLTQLSKFRNDRKQWKAIFTKIVGDNILWNSVPWRIWFLFLFIFWGGLYSEEQIRFFVISLEYVFKDHNQPSNKLYVIFNYVFSTYVFHGGYDFYFLFLARFIVSNKFIFCSYR